MKPSTVDSYTDVVVAMPAEVEEHCHWSRPEPPSAVPQLCTAFLICFFFMLCELFGGYVAGSLSVMSDAAHMLSDCGGFGLALIAFKCSSRAPNAQMSYGYRRAEVLGAVASVLMIWGLTAYFVYMAVIRIRKDETIINADIMVIVAASGVFFNVILAVVLQGFGSEFARHHHTHGGASCAQAHGGASPSQRATYRPGNGVMVNGDYTTRAKPTPPKTASKNINMRAARVHVIGDLIQSCGVMVAAILIKIYPGAKLIDPICTFVFSVLVVVTSARVLRDALKMLMQGVPSSFRYHDCVSALSSVSGVRHVHSVHAWALSSHHTVLTAHVAIDELADWETVLGSCQHIARTQFDVSSASFQVERYRGDMGECVQCRQPGAAP